MKAGLLTFLAAPVILIAAVLPFSAPRAATVTARATLADGGGKPVGKATFTSTSGGVRIRVEVRGLRPGSHGIHLHAAGKCEGPEFTSAGGHFNPASKQHGTKNPQGAHAGDLPNLTVGRNGKGKADFTARGARLGEGAGSLLGPGGTALVIHADQDDERTDPSGHSGARIACGVVTRR